mmetsp:Transcript_71505/g.118848  ORF Transcript_71505/g.118848 Transcript_71505/m.118848 type:complete len:93 (-) Transcript_71505:351-629(-)
MRSVVRSVMWSVAPAACVCGEGLVGCSAVQQECWVWYGAVLGGWVSGFVCGHASSCVAMMCGAVPCCATLPFVFLREVLSPKLPNKLKSAHN